VLLFFHHLKKKCGRWCNKNETQRIAMQEHNFDTLTKFFVSMGGGKVFIIIIILHS
jgi:hypothetical protein